MAGSVISVMPVIGVFLLSQEFFIQGITLLGPQRIKDSGSRKQADKEEYHEVWRFSP